MAPPDPLARVQAIADVAVDIAGQDGPDLMLARVAHNAHVVVPSCDSVSATLVSRNPADLTASTGELATECDRLQHELGQGPLITAIVDGKPVRVSDVADDARWPSFGPRAAQLGVGSVLALPLTTHAATVGALSLYADAVDAFDGDDDVFGAAYARHAAMALAHSQLEANLRVALQTREEIGRAVGILMERHRITAQAGFEMLVGASQRSHRKLREVAAWMTDTGEDPAALVRANRVIAPADLAASPD
jgi:GAF domain-containing protein